MLNVEVVWSTARLEWGVREVEGCRMEWKAPF